MTLRRELGSLLRDVSRVLKTALSCEKTYVMQFAEAAGHHHVHFHVVPQAADMPPEHRGAEVFHYLREGERTTDAEMNAFAASFAAALAAPSGN